MSDSKTLWIVGKVTKWLVKDKQTGHLREAKVYELFVEWLWEFVGATFIEEEAKDMCVTSDYFIGPYVIGQQDKLMGSVDWPGGYFPKWGTYYDPKK